MPTDPLSLPEFDRPFTWAMCRNAMCAHFGIPYTGGFPEPGKPATDDNHYRLEPDGRLRCKRCKQSFELKSNRAVRPVARYFLGLSLPFADCPDPKCANHGNNVFEHYVNGKSRRRSKRRYSIATGDYVTTCITCQKRLSLGEPLGIRAKPNEKDEQRADEKIKENPELNKAEVLREIRQQKREAAKSLEIIIEGVMDKRPVTETIRQRRGSKQKISTSAYYRRLNRLGACLREYQSWCNARLLDPGLDIDRNQPVRVYTDVLQVSLSRLGTGSRFQFLNIIVSVLALERSGFILAAHPAFLPEKFAPPEETLIDSAYPGRPALFDDWDSLWHPGQIDWDAPEEDGNNDPDISRGGYFVHSPYAEAAHFLVVDKMLRRFKQVFYYMDAARDLYPAALCALAEHIRSGRVEVALFQHDKWERKEGHVSADIKYYSDDEKAALLKSAYDEMERRFDNKANPKKGELPLPPEKDNRVRAGLFKGAVKGGRSKKGGWAWLHYPPDSKNYYGCRTLWLTRMPHKTFETDGAPLLFHATLQPVDSLMNSMRQRVRALSRPEERAKPGRSYMHSYFRIDTVLSELWIYLLGRNYRLRTKTRQEAIPAHKLGLMKDREAEKVTRSGYVIEEDFCDIAMGFRLGLKEAARMTKWLR